MSHIKNVNCHFMFNVCQSLIYFDYHSIMKYYIIKYPYLDVISGGSGITVYDPDRDNSNSLGL